MISSRLPLVSFVLVAAAFGVALSAGCNPTPRTLPVSLGQGGDDCCFGNGNGNGNGNVTGVGSTGTGVDTHSYCDKWVSQCPNDNGSPQAAPAAAAECHALCEQGQQLTTAFCYDSACEVELGICLDAANAADLLTLCAQAHGWLPSSSTTIGFGGASNVASTGVGPGPTSTSGGPSSNATTVGQGPGPSTGSGGVCDNSGDCTTCQNCAEAGPCSGAFAACNNNADCVTFSNCYALCQLDDMACGMACENASPNGVNDYIAFAQCVICDFCSVDCDGPNSGC